ncbi:hypothetical protein Sango_2467600 [Sesamum angolense]|uniref:Retrotransposon Copia-like N-terminal domain-containing protein n=1 Tax=Sesamum angolense TaxID=2727404 RepID=A0AAE2BKC6_9LAMI|nr:hypothetical protein Sango_2467600 [Sesamum angolense]
MTTTNITASINTIPMLNGSNFKSWKENLEIVLGVMDLDLALREDSPPALTNKSTSEQKREKERYTGKGNIREYIMKMSHLASKLKALKLDLSEDLLVHLVVISLSTQFSQFKVSYNCQKETWSLNELISHWFKKKKG